MANWIKRTNYPLQSVSTTTVSYTGARQSFGFISSKWHHFNSGGGGHGGLNAQNEEQLFWTANDSMQQTPACLQGDGGRHGDLNVWITKSESVVFPYLFASANTARWINICGHNRAGPKHVGASAKLINWRRFWSTFFKTLSVWNRAGEHFWRRVIKLSTIFGEIIWRLITPTVPIFKLFQWHLRAPAS